MRKRSGHNDTNWMLKISVNVRLCSLQRTRNSFHRKGCSYAGPCADHKLPTGSNILVPSEIPIGAPAANVAPPITPSLPGWVTTPPTATRRLRPTGDHSNGSSMRPSRPCRDPSTASTPQAGGSGRADAFRGGVNSTNTGALARWSPRAFFLKSGSARWQLPRVFRCSGKPAKFAAGRHQARWSRKDPSHSQR